MQQKDNKLIQISLVIIIFLLVITIPRLIVNTFTNTPTNTPTDTPTSHKDTMQLTKEEYLTAIENNDGTENELCVYGSLIDEIGVPAVYKIDIEAINNPQKVSNTTVKLFAKHQEFCLE